MNDQELRDSIRDLGPLLPVLKYGGAVIDGRRRARIAPEVGRRVVEVELFYPQALRALWVLHPERAFELAGPMRLEEYARAFGVRMLTVAEQLHRQRLTARVVAASELTGEADRMGPTPDDASGLTTLLQCWVSPAMMALIRKHAPKNRSAFVRDAIATHLTRHGVPVPSAQRPLASSPRAPRTVPGVEHRPRGGKT